MCEELEISRDSYYKWLKRKDSKNRYEINHDSLKPLIQYYYDLSNSTAGYRQIKDQLQEHEGIVISYYMAYILKCKTMKLNAVRESSKNKGKYRVTTKDNEQKYTYQNIAENIEIDDISKVRFNLNNSHYEGQINGNDSSKAVDITFDKTSTWTLTGDSYINTLTIQNGKISRLSRSIKSNGYDIYYNANLNEWLNGKTIRLSGGGKLIPVFYES